MPEIARSERWFSLAGLTVRLHSPEQHVVELFHRPFSHLRQPDERAQNCDIDVEITSGGSRPEVPARSANEFHADVGRHRFSTSEDGRIVYHEVLDSGSIWKLDRQTRRVSVWIESVERVTLYEKGKPLVNLLPLIVESFGLLTFHGALVSWQGTGVLFVGAGGSGKSTSALTCLRGGFDFVAEDLVILEEKGDSFIGHGVYSTAWFEPDHLARLGNLSQEAQTGGIVEERKNVLMLAELHPDRMLSSAAIEHTILPRVRADEDSSIEPASRPEAVRQLAPNCLMTASRIDTKGFEALVRLVKATRCHRLHLGRNLDSVPDLVRNAIAGL